MKKIIILTCSFLTFFEVSTYAQKNDPYKKDQSKKSVVKPDKRRPKNVSSCFEVFSISLADAASLQRSKPNDETLYDKLTKGVTSETVKQKKFIIMKGRSGERHMSETIIETVYPTEYIPAEVHTNKGTPTAPPIIIPPIATAFETRNLGMIIECEPTIGADNNIVDVRLAVENVAFADNFKYGQGVSEVTMPKFETRRITTSVTTLVNRPSLISTLNHPPFSQIDKSDGNNVYFVFLTVTIDQL